MARLCFDVDGVICDDREDEQYGQREPYEFADRIRRLKDDGHVIIFQTARYMSRHTAQGADRKGRKELADWLDFHEIPYDELHFGKASADLYVDDKAFRLRSNDGVGGWDGLMNFVAAGLEPDLSIPPVGSTVELKSGSPSMTVEKADGPNLTVVYYDRSDNLCRTTLNASSVIQTDQTAFFRELDEEDEDDDYEDDSDLYDSELESGA